MTMTRGALARARGTTIAGRARMAMADAMGVGPALSADARRRAHRLALLLRLGAVCALAVIAGPATSQDLSPVATMLDTILTAMTGPIGQAMAALAIVGAGMACLFGRANFAWFGAVVAGVVLVFSAETITGGFAGGE